MSAFWIGCLPYGFRCQSTASAFTKPRHQVHSGVNNPPRHVAPERSDHHGPDLETVRCGDTNCARDGQRHDQTEKDFREPFNRLEYPIRQPHENPQNNAHTLIRINIGQIGQPILPTCEKKFRTNRPEENPPPIRRQILSAIAKSGLSAFGGKADVPTPSEMSANDASQTWQHARIVRHSLNSWIALSHINADREDSLC